VAFRSGLRSPGSVSCGFKSLARDLDSESQYDNLSVGQKLSATDHVLKKPFAPQELIDMVFQILGGQAQDLFYRFNLKTI